MSNINEADVSINGRRVDDPKEKIQIVHKFIYVAWMFIISGAMMLGFGAYSFYSTRSFLSNAQEAEGVVVAVDWRESATAGSSNSGARKRTTPVAYTVVDFKTEDGRQITHRSNYGTNPSEFAEGDRVTMLYDPEHPSQAEIRSFTGLWMSSIILSVVGLSFLTGGLIARRTVKKFIYPQDRIGSIEKNNQA